MASFNSIIKRLVEQQLLEQVKQIDPNAGLRPGETVQVTSSGPYQASAVAVPAPSSPPAIFSEPVEALARVNAPPPAPPPQYADPVYAAPVPTPTPGPRPAPTPFPSTFQPQPLQQQLPAPNYAPPAYGQQGIGNANFIRDSYGVRSGLAEPGTYFGGYDFSLFDRIRQQALAGARPPVPMAQGGDVLLNFLRINRML